VAPVGFGGEPRAAPVGAPVRHSPCDGGSDAPAFVESAVNQVISKRMVKKQQMQWTPRGAHLLLQTRTKLLN
jgi:hypothetical protein